MRILVYGECEQYGSGAWCYYDALIEMGHEVTFFSPADAMKLYETSIIYRVVRKLRSGEIFEWHRRKHMHNFLQNCLSFKPDIIIILKGLMVDGLVVEQLKNEGIWIVLINHDDFFSAFKYNTSTILLKAIPYYDYVFCTKEVNVAEIKQYNPNTEMFLFAYYPKIHHPPLPDENDKKVWQSDIVFVGNTYPLRIRQLEYLVTHIKGVIDLKIYGPNWNKKVNRNSPIRKYLQNKVLNPKEMAKAIFYSKVSLGFLCKENRDDYTQRSFEVPASKGVLLAERTARHLQFYEEGIEAEFFDSNNFEELTKKVKMLLNDKGKRALLSESGFKKVTTSKHTYKDRLERCFYLYNHRKV